MNLFESKITEDTRTHEERVSQKDCRLCLHFRRGHTAWEDGTYEQATCPNPRSSLRGFPFRRTDCGQFGEG